jgi:hypothetical protein
MIMNPIKANTGRKDSVSVPKLLVVLYCVAVGIALAFAMVFIPAFVHYHHGWSDAGVGTAFF